MQTRRPDQHTDDPSGSRGSQIWSRRANVAISSLLFLLALAAVGVAIALVSRSEPDTIPGVVSFDHLPRNHTMRPVIYPQTPPVGGAHYPVWQNCGTYDAPVQNEYAVQSLENGAVWITYQPDLPAEAAAELRDLVGGQPYVLLSPYPGLPAPVVASAWGVQLQVNSAADPRLPWFIAKYRRGPQTPEPDAPCVGGVGMLIIRT